MRIRDQETGEEENVTLTPLIDMVFLLLIFFLVATTISKDEREGEVTLASSAHIQPISGPARQIVVNIRRDGGLVVSRRAVSADELGAQLKQAVAQNPKQEVLIRADKDSVFRAYASVLDCCHQAGIDRHKIATVHDDGTP